MLVVVAVLMASACTDRLVTTVEHDVPAFSAEQLLAPFRQLEQATSATIREGTCKWSGVPDGPRQLEGQAVIDGNFVRELSVAVPSSNQPFPTTYLVTDVGAAPPIEPPS